MQLPIDYDKATWQQRKQARIAYIVQQEGKCAHCGELLKYDLAESWDINPELFPKEFFDYPVHLHHDRTTGLTIGAVHAYCNAVLWQYHGE